MSRLTAEGEVDIIYAAITTVGSGLQKSQLHVLRLLHAQVNHGFVLSARCRVAECNRVLRPPRHPHHWCHRVHGKMFGREATAQCTGAWPAAGPSATEEGQVGEGAHRYHAEIKGTSRL